jgi:hypothetical protein
MRKARIARALHNFGATDSAPAMKRFTRSLGEVARLLLDGAATKLGANLAK